MRGVVQREGERAAGRVFAALGLQAERVGTLLRQRGVRIRDRAAVVADLPLDALIDGVPIRSLMATGAAAPDTASISPLRDPAAMLLELLARPNLRSRRPIYRRFDHQVGNNTVIGPGY